MAPRPIFSHHQLFVRKAFPLADKTIYILAIHREAGHKSVCIEQYDRFYCEVASPHGKVLSRHLVPVVVVRPLYGYNLGNTQKTISDAIILQIC